MTILADLGFTELSPGVYSRTAWAHPLRGTCVPECPAYGECHCCGEPTRVAVYNHSQFGYVKGRPFTYHAGHNPQAQANLQHGRPPHAPHWVGPGWVPFSRVAPMLKWLEDRYGQQVIVARLIGMDKGHYRRFRLGHYRLTQPKVWRRVQAVVLAHRTPVDPFGTYEERRVLPVGEQVHLDDLMRRTREREEQRRTRAKRREQT